MRSGREKDTQQTVTYVVGRVARHECQRALIKSLCRVRIPRIVGGLHLDIHSAFVIIQGSYYTEDYVDAKPLEQIN